MTPDEYKANLDKLRAKFDEIDKQLDEIGEQCDEITKQSQELLRADIEKTKPISPHPRWKPAYMERYYIVWCNGAVEETYWAGNESDNNEYSTGNVFRTKAEAEFAAEHMKVLAEKREWAGKWDGPVILVYNVMNCEIVTQYSSCTCNGAFKFSTVHNAIECIKAVGKERIKKYYFMIPDNEERYGKSCR